MWSSRKWDKVTCAGSSVLQDCEEMQGSMVQCRYDALFAEKTRPNREPVLSGSGFDISGLYILPARCLLYEKFILPMQVPLPGC